MIKFSPNDILPYSADLDRGKVFPSAAFYKKESFELCFIAARHEFSRQSETHRLIDRCFEEFKPRALVLEGLMMTGDTPWDTDIEKHFVTAANEKLAKNPDHLAEPYHALLRAKEIDATVYCGEPADKLTREYAVAQNYSVDDFAGEMFLSWIANWRKAGTAESELPQMWQRHYKNEAAFVSSALSEDFATFRTWFKNRTGDVFSLELIDNYYVAPDLSRPFGTLAHLSGTSSHFRDIHILKIIETALNTHHRVLVVYGGSHYWTLKQALDKGLDLSVALRSMS